nr:rRNA cytosine-C5-methyltransferase [Bacteroidaceae bacterium]
VLDLCAAPGGKSTLLRACLHKDSILICNEILRNRAQVLAENMVKWGHSHVMVTNNASEDFADCENAFDLIVADVPCSGEGMFRKDDEAIANWSLENVTKCAERQRHIINNIWSALKPGGYLVYSTCTYNVEENERNVAWIMRELGAQALPLSIPGEGVVGNLIGEDFPVCHFFPHRVKGEGFFMALLRKNEEIGFQPMHLTDAAVLERGLKKKDKKHSALPVKEILQTTRQWVQHSDDYYWEVNEEEVRALPAQLASFYFWGKKQGWKILEAGIQVATLKGRDAVPAHPLAMNISLNQDAFAQQEVSYAQAIAYLRKDAVVLSPTTAKGYVLLTYRQQPIGFVKNLGNRANNLYPQEWRIRSSYVPEEFRII